MSAENYRTSLEKIGKYLDLSTSITLVINHEKKISFINKEGAKILGYERSEILGKNWFDHFIPESNKEEMISVFEKIFKKQSILTQHYENPVKLRDGSEKLIAWNNSVVKNDKGKVLATISFGEIVTEESRLKQELSREKQLSKTIAETLPVGISLLDKKGKIRFVNDKMREIANLETQDITKLNYNSEKWNAKDFDGNRFPEEEYPFKRVKTTLKPVYNIHHSITVDDQTKYLSVNMAPIIDNEGKFDGAVAIINDISAQIRARKDLIESEEKFRNIAEQSIFGIIIMQDNTYEYVNERFAEMTGYSVEELKQWGPLEFMNTVHPEDRKRILANVKARSEGENNQAHHYEFRGFKKSGEMIWGELYSKPINYKGKPANLITIADITKRKNTEKQYKEAFNRAEFYKDIFTHDINNILQNIKSANELINMFKDSDAPLKKIQDLTEIINTQVDRGANLVNNIRKLSDLEDIKLSLEILDAHEVLNKSISAIKHSYYEKNINIEIKTSIENMNVKANHFLMDVFDNLLINAITYNHEETIYITIEISRIEKKGQKYFKFEFKDNGVGITEQRKKVIFNREKQINREGKGMGLGLSLVKKILESFNGNIRVEDRIAGDHTKGSNFIIILREVEGSDD